MANYAYDDSRSFISLTGKDCASFLQGIITNDIHKVTDSNSIYTALLTPQGRYLFDFFVFKNTDGLMIDVDKERQEDLVKLLKKYKLRSDVEIKRIYGDSLVRCAFGDDVFSYFDIPTTPGFTKEGEGYIVYVDPRLSDLGVRIVTLDQTIFDKMGLELVKYREYDRHRLSLGVPEGGTDMITEKAIPLECGLDELNAVSWDKGCYLGQELTARTKHRGLVRKRLLPVTFEPVFIPELSPIFHLDQEVGSMRSSDLGHGLALIRLEVLEILAPDETLISNGEKLQVQVPTWMKF